MVFYELWENTSKVTNFNSPKNNYPKLENYENTDKNRFNDSLFIIFNVILNNEQVIIIIIKIIMVIWYTYKNRY